MFINVAAFYVYILIKGYTRPNFFCDPVVLESICYRTRANRLINKSKTTGGLKNCLGQLNKCDIRFEESASESRSPIIIHRDRK